jgi:hypothetical protein
MVALLEGPGLLLGEWIAAAMGDEHLGALGETGLGSLAAQLVRSGLVYAAAPMSSDRLDCLNALADLAGDDASALRELDQLGRSYASLDMNRRDAARARIAALCAELGAEGTEGIAPVIEDSVVRGVTGALGHDLQQELEQQLGPLLGLYARRDTDGVHQRMLVDIFVATYGAGGHCDSPSHFAAQVLRMCERHRPDDAAAFPRFQQARAGNDRFMQVLAALAPEGAAEVSLGHDELAILLRACPATVPATAAPRRLGVLLQVAAASEQAMARGEFELVLNQTLPGWGRFHSRYAQLFTDTSWADALSAVTTGLQRAAGAEPVELQTTLQHNGHVRPALTERAFAMPGEESDRPGLLPLDGLCVAHDAANDTLYFTLRGEPVLPLYLGCLHTMSLPPLQRVLADSVPGLAYQADSLRPLDYIERQRKAGGAPVRAYPRMRCGRVVIQRRAWAIDIDALPSAQTDDYALFCAWQQWQGQHGLPARVYVRIIARQPGQATRGDDHKPVYLDFGNHLLLRSFTAGLERDKVRTLVFEESLPAHTLESVDLGLGGAHVAELQLELEEGAA